MSRVIVVGAGVAGTSAALSAAASGATVTLVRGRPGASSLSSGALDLRAWEDGPSRLDAEAAKLLQALGGYALHECVLATTAGTRRRSDGRDASLLDVSPFANELLVAVVEHPSWHGATLARHFGTASRPIALLKHPRERSMHHAELAALHDDAERLGFAAERIRAALSEGGSFRAVLLPPWLGIRGFRADALSALVGLPCGEALATFDSPAGMRFEHARARWLQNTNITSVRGVVTRVAFDSTWQVALDGETLSADAVVLATGGILGGGIAYAPGEATVAGANPPLPRGPFELAYEAPVRLGYEGRAIGVPGSLFGVAPETLTWPQAHPAPIEMVGILGSLDPGLFVAGEAIADRPRTWLEAFASGVSAGRSAVS